MKDEYTASALEVWVMKMSHFYSSRWGSEPPVRTIARLGRGFSVLISALLLISSCADFLAPIADHSVGCRSDDECPDDWFCHDSLCLKHFVDCTVNGRLEAGETCDDGNSQDDDACLSNCQFARCGDATVRTDLTAGEPGFEACDDGNQNNEDACTNACEVAQCGDGFVGPNEACDDADQNGSDTCTITCQLPRCGDGLLSGAEQCDDGNAAVGDGCDPQCFIEVCGNGRLDFGEVCDDGNRIAEDECTNGCTVARCGDGVRYRTTPDDPNYEECDDGNDDPLDRCAGCRATVCGDGIVQEVAGEACDDANTREVDGCLSDCTLARCGDGYLRADLPLDAEGYEFCDDGNGDEGDACLSSCQVASCGDGEVSAGEELCDDGNAIDDDECSNTCGVGYVRLAAGENHQCGLREDGTVWCWGSNSHGQVGDGTTTNRWAPTEATGLTGVVQISAGKNASCAVTDTEQLWCWGQAYGQRPIELGADQSWISGSVGHGMVAALTRDGIPFDVGSGRDPAQIEGLGTQQQLVREFRHTCALDNAGEVRCWGHNGYGEVGTGSVGGTVAAPTLVTLPEPVVQLTLGSSHTCALLNSGEVWCWGWSLGTGFAVSTGVPTRVAGLESVSAVWSNRLTNFARTDDGRLWSWGPGIGDLGRAYVNSRTPQPIEGVEGVISLAAGTNFACAIGSERRRVCWGSEYYGANLLAFGRGQPQWNLPPTLIEGFPAARQVSAGTTHSCAVLIDGSVRCWGAQALRGDGRMLGEASDPPSAVLHLAEVGALAVGNGLSCAVQNGQSACWGTRQPGNGWGSASTPALILGLPAIADLAVGFAHNCLRSPTGAVWCWGNNPYGQLGLGNSEDGHTRPRAIEGLTDAEQLGLGGSHSCARHFDNSISCWGGSYDQQVAPGVTEDQYQPLRVEAIDQARELAVGGSHNCIIDGDGAVRCWGSFGNGALGVTSFFDEDNQHVRPQLEALPAFPSAPQKLSAGTDYTCALLEDARVSCWGENDKGQLGNGVAAARHEHEVVANLSGVTQLSAGTEHACAVADEGAVYCWGATESSQITPVTDPYIPPLPMLIE
jgi:cysteine-rich repeat protein